VLLSPPPPPPAPSGRPQAWPAPSRWDRRWPSVTPDERRAWIATLPPRYAWQALLVTLGALYVLGTAVAVGLGSLGMSAGLMTAAVYVVGFGLMTLWCRVVGRQHGGMAAALGAPSRATARWGDVGWGAVTWLTMYAASFAVGIVLFALRVPTQSNGAQIADVSVGTQVAFACAAIIGAPIVEELMFRGVLMRALIGRIGIRWGVVAQGVLFGAYHVNPSYGWGNLGMVATLSAVGVMLGFWTVQRQGRLLPAMVAHAILNTIAVTLTVFVL
jgi:uncharacterized protein